MRTFFQVPTGEGIGESAIADLLLVAHGLRHGPLGSSRRGSPDQARWNDGIERPGQSLDCARTLDLQLTVGAPRPVGRVKDSPPAEPVSACSRSAALRRRVSHPRQAARERSAWRSRHIEGPLSVCLVVAVATLVHPSDDIQVLAINCGRKPRRLRQSRQAKCR
jgi:hypothetical protein